MYRLYEIAMGCLCSKSSKSDLNEDSVEEPKYSWDVRPKIDPRDYTIQNLKGETTGRLPGTVNGMQFIIQNCEKCNIYIFDHMSQVTVDDCNDCNIFLGPIKGSVFIRDCKNCKFVLSCQQFRTRDCQKIDSFICCVSQPIIEASTGMKFGCYQYYYPKLQDQFKSSGLSVYNNNWSNIHDFTPVTEQRNYTYTSTDTDMEKLFPLPSSDQFSEVQVNCSKDSSVVPWTLGKQRKSSDESCLVVFFSDEFLHKKTELFMTSMKQNHTGCVLVQSKEILMQRTDAIRVFGSENYNQAISNGPVIALEYNGDSCIQSCQDTLSSLNTQMVGLAFVSSNADGAKQQIDNFFNFADMQMNA